MLFFKMYINFSEVETNSQWSACVNGVLETADGKRGVALKFLTEAAHQRDFLIEAATMSQLTHPNVLMLYGVSISGEFLFFFVSFLKAAEGCLPENYLRKLKLAMTYFQEFTLNIAAHHPI